MSTVENLQPVARIGREECAAQHQDAAQHTVLGHLGTNGSSAAFVRLGSDWLFPILPGEGWRIIPIRSSVLGRIFNPLVVPHPPPLLVPLRAPELAGWRVGMEE